MPPDDHDCSLRDIVVAMSNQIAKLEHELAKLKKAHIGPKSERSKMPRVPGTPSTPETRLAKRRAQAADRAQTETVRTEHKVPAEERSCPACGNDKLGFVSIAASGVAGHAFAFLKKSLRFIFTMRPSG